MALNKPGPIALLAAGDAEKNIGVTEEGGENRGKYVEIYLKDVGLGPGYPWCAALVHFRLRTAAHELGLTLPAGFPCSGYCPDYKDWAVEKGLWIPVAAAKAGAGVQRGDLCLFYFPAKARVAHAGIVTGLRSGGVITVEGNTGPEAGVEVNREGDGVYRKIRDWSEFGQFGGFIRLP